jgi:mono/diheme cytochrome c family protein
VEGWLQVELDSQRKRPTGWALSLLMSAIGDAMFTRIIIALVALAVAFAILGADTQPAIKKVSPTPTSPASGQEMFMTHCAACHGRDARGTGPAGAALKTPPADLTKLSAKNGGKFPEMKVYATIRGDSDNPAHGSKEMPVWGSVFQSMAKDNGAIVQMRISNLTGYIKSIQGK